MTNPKADRTPKLRAIAIALVVFAILHVLLLLAVRESAGTPERIASVEPILNVAAYLIYMVAGFVAGAIAKAAPILHGVATGLFGAVIAAIFFAATERDLYVVAVLIANGIVLAGIGGACSLLIAKKEL